MFVNIALGLLLTIAIIQGAVIAALVYQLAELRKLANAGGPLQSKLPVGSLAPHFSAIDFQSKRTIHSSTMAGRRVVLCFLNADCQTCRSLAFDLSRMASATLGGLIVYYDADAEAEGSVFEALASVVPVLCKGTVDVSDEFHVEHSPVAIILDEEWRISGISFPIRAEDLQSLLEAAPAQVPASALMHVAG